jgi:hypothetical protein
MKTLLCPLSCSALWSRLLFLCPRLCINLEPGYGKQTGKRDLGDAQDLVKVVPDAHRYVADVVVASCSEIGRQ